MSALRRLCALSVLCGCVAAMLVGSVDAQEAQRRVTVEPAAGLENQVVRVSWEGFNPSEGELRLVAVAQCRGTNPASLDDCNQIQRPPGGEYLVDGTAVANGVTQADGTGSVFLEVRPATELQSLNCSASGPCSVVAYEIDGDYVPVPGEMPPTAVTAPIEFAPSSVDCPRVETSDVITGGEASAAHALYAWSARVCTAADKLALDYTESTSPEGRVNFLSGLIDVGITSMPATTEEQAGSERKFTYAPIDVSGVVVAFYANDVETGERIMEMNLSPRLVAILIAGFPGPGEFLFSDPEFVALNQGHAWPTSVYQPLLRAEQNADTHLLTRWLDTDAAARRFLDGNDPDAPVDAYWKRIDYPTELFESRNPNYIEAYGPLTGTANNVRRLFIGQGSPQSQTPRRDVGVLGVLDVVTARKFGLPTANLRPANAPDGTGFIAPDADGLTAGFEAMAVDANQLTRSAVVTALDAYPLVKVDYAMVPTSGVSPQKAADIARFLDYARVDGQAPGLLSPGYLPLPAELQTENTTAAKSVIDGATAGPPAPPPAGPPASPPTGGPSTPPQDLGGPFPSADSGSGSGTGDLGSGGLGSSDLLPGASGVATAALPGTGAPAADRAAARAKVGAGAETLEIGNFSGGDNQRILPVLLVAGLAAFAVGPMLTLIARRSRPWRWRLRLPALRPAAHPLRRAV